MGATEFFELLPLTLVDRFYISCSADAQVYRSVRQGTCLLTIPIAVFAHNTPKTEEVPMSKNSSVRLLQCLS